MDEALKNFIVKRLNEVQALKSCIVRISKDDVLYIENINNTSFLLIVTKWLLYDDYKVRFEKALEYEGSDTYTFLIQSNLKLKDVALLDIALKEIHAYTWQEGSFEYIKKVENNE